MPLTLGWWPPTDQGQRLDLTTLLQAPTPSCGRSRGSALCGSLKTLLLFASAHLYGQAARIRPHVILAHMLGGARLLRRVGGLPGDQGLGSPRAYVLDPLDWGARFAGVHRVERQGPSPAGLHACFWVPSRKGPVMKGQ